MYRVRSDGSLKTQGEIRQMHPNTSLPKTWDTDTCDYLGIDPVFESPTPETTRYQLVFKNGVEQLDGRWYWAWTIVDMDNDARIALDNQQADYVRSTRNARLAECDWTQLADAPVDSLAWANYRQALRDVPNQAGFPWDIIWPTKP